MYNEPNPWNQSSAISSTSASDHPHLRHKQGLGGIVNFYRGFLPTLYGMIPYAGVSFLSYESFKSWALERGENWTTVNIKSLKRRSGERHHNTKIDHDTPQNSSHQQKQNEMNSNDKNIEFSTHSKHTQLQLSWWAQFLVGGLSGALAMTVSYPFEVIRRHMQVVGRTGFMSDSEVMAGGHKGGKGEGLGRGKYPGTFEVASYIYNRKGFKGFFVGLSIGYVKITPMFAGTYLFVFF